MITNEDYTKTRERLVLEMKFSINEKGQAVAPKTIPFGKEAFLPIEGTEIRWLGFAGILIHARETVCLIDPLLTEFDMPVLIEQPIKVSEIPHVDATLLTHIDNDHFSRTTCKQLMGVCDAYHAPVFVAEEMRKEEIDGIGHAIKDTFKVKDLSITSTPALHNWQSEIEKYQYREWQEEDACGFWIETKDGTIWLPGDSKLIKEHLQMPSPDVILFDFSDNEWHITLEGAVKLANTYPKADLICIHWGSVDAPTMSPFNANPKDLMERITHPQRIRVLAPGEPFSVRRKN